MKPKMIIKLAVDIGMTAALLLLMAYELVGQAAHEWIGIGMFVLFIIHHILNGGWSRNILKGRYHLVHSLLIFIGNYVCVGLRLIDRRLKESLEFRKGR